MENCKQIQAVKLIQALKKMQAKIQAVKQRFVLKVAGLAALLAVTPAHATPDTGAPVDGALGFQPSATEIAARIDDFHTLLLIIITLICLFVAALLFWTIGRYNSRANPTPAQFSHNSTIEVIWTAVPVLILIVIAFPSFPLLYATDKKPTTTTNASGSQRPLNPEDWLTIKTYGRQWYWSYIYPDNSDEPVEFDSYMLEKEEMQPGQIYRLSVDYPVVVPAGRHVNLLLAASDVIHSWAIPAFKLKTDAVPGRLNELWFKTDQKGIYYGQCSELCGIRHAFMPIELRVVSEQQYQKWHALAKEDVDDALDYLNQIQPHHDSNKIAALNMNNSKTAAP